MPCVFVKLSHLFKYKYVLVPGSADYKAVHDRKTPDRSSILKLFVRHGGKSKYPPCVLVRHAVEHISGVTSKDALKQSLIVTSIRNAPMNVRFALRCHPADREPFLVNEFQVCNLNARRVIRKHFVPAENSLTAEIRRFLIASKSDLGSLIELEPEATVFVTFCAP